MPRLALYGPDGEPVALPEGGGVWQAVRQGGQHALLAFSSANEIGTAQLNATVGVVPLPSPNQTVSQVADGNGWQTTLTLMNSGSEPASFLLRCWTDAGAPWALSFDGLTEGSIAAGGSRTIKTLNRSAVTQQGWAELIASKPIRLYGAFRSASGQEAIVVGTTRTARFLLPFDNTQSLVTAMALVNINAAQAATVRVVFRDELGLQLGSGTLTLPPRGHEAFALADRFSMSSARRGIAEFTMDLPDLIGLGLRFQPNGTFTSIPVQPVQ